MASIPTITPVQSDLDWKKYWSPESQAIAPAECLLDHLSERWTPAPLVFAKRHRYGAGRTVHIYLFQLYRDGETVEIPVPGNPVVRRLITERRLRVILYDETRLTEPL
jgi:hypothetical protein